MKWKVKYINLAIFLLLTAVPLVAGIGYALLYSVALVGILSTGFTLDNWCKVLTASAFWWSLGFSFYVATVTIALSVCMALAVVLRFGQWFRRGTLSFMIYLPLVFPAMVMAFYAFQLLSKSGIISRIAFQTGLIKDLNNFPDLINDNWGAGIIFAHVCMATPFLIILFNNLYQNENLPAFVAIAKTMGATRRQIIQRVEIPVLLNKSFSTLMLYFIFVMNSYEIPLLLGSQSRQMISVFTIQKLQRFNLQDIPQAYVASVIYTGLVIIVIATGLSHFNKKKTTMNQRHII
jgi:putative spermidine/putrescine transport system permease protein